jgi:hypothetical protein
MSANPSLKTKARRDRVRALHLIVSLPLGAMVYAPAELALQLRPVMQFALFPLIACSGLWMWQGYRLRATPRGKPSRITLPAR